MSLRVRARTWLRAIFRPASVDDDLQREVRHHLDMEVAQRIARGEKPAEARRQARLAFGGVERFRGEVRDERPGVVLDDAATDVRYALRGFRRAPTHSLTTVLLLALGVGAASTVASVVAHVLYRPLPLPEAERLVFVAEASDAGDELPASYPNFVDWKARSRTLTHLSAAFATASDAVIVQGSAVRSRVRPVTRDYFQTLGVRPVAGRTFSASEATRGGTPTAVVSEGFWRTALRGAPLSDTLVLKRRGVSHTIVGVMPRSLANYTPVDVWVPLELESIDVRGAGNYSVYGRLGSGVDLELARRELGGIATELKREYGDASVSSRVLLTPLRDRIVSGSRRPLELLLVAAVVLLLATCASLTLMQVARGLARRRELDVRSALGASRMRLFRQLLTEQVLLALIGGTLGVAFTAAGLQVAARYGVDLVPRVAELQLSGTAIAIAVAASLLSLVIVGSASIASTLRAGGAGLIAGGRSVTSRRQGLDRVLIATQAAAAVALVAGAALIARGVRRVVTADVGYDRRELVSAHVSLTSTTYDDFARRQRTAAELQRGMGAVPGVQDVAFATHLPNVVGGNQGPILVPPFGDPKAQSSWATTGSLRIVSPNYFRVTRIPLVAGRELSESDGPRSKVAVVNRALAAKAWPGKDPIGQQLRALVDSRADTFTVVGVVGDARVWWAEAGAQREVYVSVAQKPELAWQLNLVMRTRLPVQSIAEEVERLVRGLDPELLATVQTLDAMVDETIADRRFIGAVISLFGLIVLLLTAAGVLGSVSYAVERRTREIGIRLAVGSTRVKVWWLVQGQVVVAACLGTAIGLGVALGSARLLAGLLYEVSPRDPIALAAAACLSLVATLVASGLPAFRALRIDPIVALREE